MKMLITAALATFALSSQALEFDPKLYVGGNYGSYQLSQSAPSVDANFTTWGLDGFVGLELLPFLAFEARVGGGLNRDLVTFADDVTVELQTNLYTSVYVRPMLNNEKAGLYGLLGYTYAEFDGEPEELTAETNHDGVSFGIGVSFVVNPHMDVRLEWKNLLDAEVLGMRGGSVGLSYTF